MNSKDIKELQNLMLKNKEWENTNSSVRKLYEEMALREMIMSCLTYGNNIYNSPYVDKYIDILGYDRVMEICKNQKEYFDTKCKVLKNVYMDNEGLSYNSLIEE